jgi:predicted nucleic acid-binding protein
MGAMQWNQRKKPRPVASDVMIAVDSSFFIALADRNDQWHTSAKKCLPHLRDDPLVISDLIISEVVTIIGKRNGGKSAVQIYQYFVDNCDIVFTDEHLLSGAMKILLRYDGSLSLSDSVSVEIMRTKKIKKILSFDADFDRITGIERIGAA